VAVVGWRLDAEPVEAWRQDAEPVEAWRQDAEPVEAWRSDKLIGGALCNFAICYLQFTFYNLHFDKGKLN
jgi:hypothetical protein